MLDLINLFGNVLNGYDVLASLESCLFLEFESICGYLVFKVYYMLVLEKCHFLVDSTFSRSDLLL